jgi:hypothetical protein
LGILQHPLDRTEVHLLNAGVIHGGILVADRRVRDLALLASPDINITSPTFGKIT